ncbi:MAG TPA: hypothetical protein VNT53_06335 [Pseudolysinimonas sp.]|nr:hypothetical protein [Pseudolysinimonas sp.]
MGPKETVRTLVEEAFNRATSTSSTSKIVEHWAVVDMFGAFVQLGLLPAPGAMH